MRIKLDAGLKIVPETKAMRHYYELKEKPSCRLTEIYLIAYELFHAWTYQQILDRCTLKKLDSVSMNKLTYYCKAWCVRPSEVLMFARRRARNAKQADESYGLNDYYKMF